VDENHKLIIVAGMDGGGTSIIAGALWHLGVDMGNIPHDPRKMEWDYKSGRPRNYLKYEDDDARTMIEKANEQNRFDSQKLVYDLWSYIEKRQDAAHGKPYGVKHPGILTVGSRTEQLQKMPVRCVYIHRSLDDVFSSNMRDMGPENYMQAQILGLRVYCLTSFLKSLPPIATFEFESARTNAWETVDTLMSTLGLTPTEQQVERTLQFIDPVKKGCGINYE